MQLGKETGVKPLTGLNKKTGKPYARPPAVEAEIEAVLEWPRPRAFGLAIDGKLKPQTLVYLMRNFKPARRDALYDALIVAFFSRLQRAGEALTKGLSDLNRERVDDLVKDRALQLLQSNRLDIFEMSFKTGAERLYLTAIAKVRLRSRTEISREDLIEPGLDVTGEEMADTLSFRQGAEMPLAEAKVALNQVFALLNEKESMAVFYVYHAGMTEKEAGQQMGCSDRNIRYLLNSAAEKARGDKKSARLAVQAKA